MANRLLIILALTLLPAACSTHYSSTTQVSDVAYLVLKGNFTGTRLQLNNTTIAVNSAVETYQQGSDLLAKFEIPTGTHQIKIFKGEQVLISRSIVVTNGQSTEINVP